MEVPRTVKKVQWLTGRIVAHNYFVSKATNKCLPFFRISRKASKFEQTLECKEAFVQLKKYLRQPPLLSKPLPRVDLYLYLAISHVVVSVVLIREEKGAHLPVYYVSYSMVLAEIRYSNLEKFALALLFASYKLKPYFQTHPVVIFTSLPLRQVFHRLKASRCLM